MTNLGLFTNGQVGMAVALLLLAILALREVARVSSGRRWRALGQALTVAATPILIIFLATVVVLIAEAFK